MEVDQASELAEKIFVLQRTHDAVRVGSILKIIAYLPPRLQAEAAHFLATWSREASGEISSAGQLLEARRWLPDADFIAAADRLYQRANVETDPRMRAMYLAYVLPILSPSAREVVVRELIDMGRALAEWDDAWFAILDVVIEAADTQSVERLVLPFIEFLQTKNRRVSFLLFIQVAIKHATARDRALQSAVTIMPLQHWEAAELIDALPALPRNVQVLGVDIIFQSLVDESTKGRPIGVLAKLFPTLAELMGEGAAAELWETIWEVTQWWP